MEEFWSNLTTKMSPQELSKFEKNIMSLGINESSLHEDAFANAFNIAKDKAESLLEDWGETSVTSMTTDSTPNKTVHNAGKIISAVGKVGASMVPAALVAAKLGIGAWGLGLGAVMLSSLLAGAALWWIGDKLKEKFSNESKIKEDKNKYPWMYNRNLIKKSEFKIEDLNMADLDEYRMVLDDILALIKKYRFIAGLEKGIIKRQAEYEKKLVLDKMKELRARGIR